MFTKIEPQEEQVEIELDMFVPFGNHSFDLFQGRLLDEMINQISVIGWTVDAEGNTVPTNVTGIRILEPIIVRPIGDGRYEILDGHYRVAAAQKLKKELKKKGMKLDSVKIPAVIKTDLTDKEALSLVHRINPIGLLINDGLDILSSDYRQTEGYKRLANELFRVDGFSLMTLDEYVEHFLLDKHNVYDLYKSIYSMGNPYVLAEDEDEDTDKAVALEIIRMGGKEIEGVAEEVRFTRQDSGYIQQLKKYLDIDLDSFDYSSTENRSERVKILFFIYTIKKEFPNVKILQMLGKPSMENIDNSFLGWKTSNGDYVKYVQHEIEMEIDPRLKTNVRKATSFIVDSWGDRMMLYGWNIAHMLKAGYDISEDMNSITAHLQELLVIEKPVCDTVFPPTPMGSLYLRLIQNGYLGQMYDLLNIYKMTAKIHYPVPPEEYMKEMRKFQAKRMSREDIDLFFTPENVQEKAKYIYLKEKISKEERRRIRRSKEKVFRFLDFFNLADPFDEYNLMDNVTELLIISCLQIILLDEQNEIFEYNFHGFEGRPWKRKGKIYVQAALKTDDRTYDALQVYWVRKVMDRSYANVGDSRIREITSKFETLCVEVLARILNCSTIAEMLEMNNYYSERLAE